MATFRSLLLIITSLIKLIALGEKVGDRIETQVKEDGAKKAEDKASESKDTSGVESLFNPPV